MSNRIAVDAAQAFLQVVWADKPPSDVELAAAIDRLLAARLDVTFEHGACDTVHPLAQDWSSLYQQLGARFPDYGYYAVAKSLAVNETELCLGDALDDLADLTRDLRDVLWLAENVGVNDASWHFAFHYEIHWGWHARELALFLHARCFP